MLSGTGGVWRVRRDDGSVVEASLRGRVKKANAGRRADGSLRRDTISSAADTRLRIVDVADCPVLSPKLMALLPALRLLAKADVIEVTDTEGGIDLVLEQRTAPNSAMRGVLARFALVRYRASRLYDAPRRETEPTSNISRLR